MEYQHQASLCMHHHNTKVSGHLKISKYQLPFLLNIEVLRSILGTCFLIDLSGVLVGALVNLQMVWLETTNNHYKKD